MLLQLLKKWREIFSILDLAYAISLDKRNQRFRPTQGYKTTFRQSLPLNSRSSSILNGFRCKCIS